MSQTSTTTTTTTTAATITAATTTTAYKKPSFHSAANFLLFLFTLLPQKVSNLTWVEQDLFRAILNRLMEISEALMYRRQIRKFYSAS